MSKIRRLESADKNRSGSQSNLDINLTQAEANALIAMPKYRENDEVVNFPVLDGSVSIPLVSADKRENFILDISQGQINLTKIKYQNRARQICILVRVEYGGPPHSNPDGSYIPCPHIHLYREGFGDKWALPIPQDKFPDTTDTWQILQCFIKYCNIVTPPQIQRGL